MPHSSHRPAWVFAFAWAAFVIGLVYPLGAAPQAPQASPAAPAGCRVTGRVLAGTLPLPGATVVVHVGPALKAATSTDPDGKYTIIFGPNTTYHLTVDLMAFKSLEQDLTLGALPCDQTLDFQLALRPRTDSVGSTSSTDPAQPAPATATPGTESQPPSTAAAATAAGPGRGAGAQAGGRAGRAGQVGQAGRFTALTVQQDANGAQTVETMTTAQSASEAASLLPPGFSLDSVQNEAVTINGTANATSIDRGMLEDRLAAIAGGQFDPATGQFAQGFGPGGGGAGGDLGFGGPGPGGGRGGGPGGGDGGGRGGGFFVGGRGARGQSPYQGTTTYSYGGSALDTPPPPLTPGAVVTNKPYSRNSFGGTIGGPVKLPGIYNDTNRRSNFQLNYSGTANNSLFDNYATVPTDAMRNGDFSASTVTLIDPLTGKPFPNNQIPADRIDPGAKYLLGFIPSPNLDSATRNYHVSTTAHSTSNSYSLRLTQNLSPTIPQRGGRGGPGGGGGGGRGGGPGGPGGGRGGPGRGGRGLTVMLNAQVQYRGSDTQSLNVFPGLGGTSKNTNVSVPVSVNIAKGRTTNNISVNYTASNSRTANRFANNTNVVGLAGITGVATDPSEWGLPNLTFSSGYSSLRDVSPSVRTDKRLTATYTWGRTIGKMRWSFGTDFRQDSSTAQSENNGRGTFTYTGLYSTNGAPVARAGSGADMADFLLGLPAQATVGENPTAVGLRGRSWDAYVEDNWQKSGKLTLMLSARYDLVFPYVDLANQMVNLDANKDFTAVVPVQPLQNGLFSGKYPRGLVYPDGNNVAPRVGFAYRLARNTIIRGGYGVNYNTGSYASIARNLTQQPPFALTYTTYGSVLAPITLEKPFVSASPTTLQNTYGIEQNFALGMAQAWNFDFSKDLTRNWTMGAGYTGTKGTDLDIVRAPNRNPDGTLRISNVQGFRWESSNGHSILQSFNLRLQRRFAHGFSTGLNYTLAKSLDNASSVGGAGGSAVAQNDQDLAAEWGLSSFDRRHQVTETFMYELPFGVNRKWLNNSGTMAKIVGEWSLNGTYTWQTGTPYTPRVQGVTTNIIQGVNGALRANLTGVPISLADPTQNEFFNTAAFSIPASGTFGNSPRNVIIGPGGNQLNASLNRNVRLGGNRAATITINANNLLNIKQFAAIDTNVNSSTFGQVTSYRAMRSMTVNLRFRF